MPGIARTKVQFQLFTQGVAAPGIGFIFGAPADILPGGGGLSVCLKRADAAVNIPQVIIPGGKIVIVIFIPLAGNQVEIIGIPG